MTEEEKKAIEILKDNIGILEGKLTIKYTNYNTVKAYNTILNLIEKLQKENEGLKEYIAIAPNLDEMTAVKYRNIQQDAYIKGRAEEQQRAEQIIYENYIPIQKVKDIIDRIDYDIKKTKEIISKNTNIYASYRKNDYQIVRLRAMNTKSLDIKKRLQKLLESEK